MEETRRDGGVWLGDNWQLMDNFQKHFGVVSKTYAAGLEISELSIQKRFRIILNGKMEKNLSFERSSLRWKSENSIIYGGSP
eukprot:1195714-Prorocentrum_minimum.AAC.1